MNRWIDRHAEPERGTNSDRGENVQFRIRPRRVRPIDGFVELLFQSFQICGGRKRILVGRQQRNIDLAKSLWYHRMCLRRINAVRNGYADDDVAAGSDAFFRKLAILELDVARP